jgi:dipeptidase E
MPKKLLLISNSTNSGEEYLGWPRQLIADFFSGTEVSRILFIPYAGVTVSYNDYTNKVKDVFEKLGLEIYSIENEPNRVEAIQKAEAIAVGGGNTFHLVCMLHKLRLMAPMFEKVNEGLPFIGWSAGANVACPSMKTTNDMPIIEPESFNCLSLVPFQINPHYLDANPEGHGGETREQRIQEFLVANPETTVVGLREATALRIEGKKMQLLGSRPMRIFQPGNEPKELSPGTDASFLLI